MEITNTKRPPLPTARYSKNRIRSKLASLVRQRSTQLEKGVIPALGANGLSRTKAIRKIKTMMAGFAHKDEQCHINLCQILRTEITTILPGTQSKFQKLRAEWNKLLEWCENHNTLAVNSPHHPSYTQNI